MFPADCLCEAVRLFGVYTAGQFDLWILAGSQKASVRAHIMSALLGRKAKQAESGINAMRDEFLRRLGISESCRAADEEKLIAVCRTFAR